MRRTLGLAVALVVGLAGTVLAGAMYRNDSGEVARALRVEFSEPAEITSMWPSFAQRDPQGPAMVIVLSSGEIAAGGWFSLTWRPDSARLVRIEWLGQSAGVRAPQPGVVRSEGQAGGPWRTAQPGVLRASRLCDAGRVRSGRALRPASPRGA